MKNQLFINKFQKGSTENPNIGMGCVVGFDTYSKKGVAILAKKATTVHNTSSVSGGIYPHFFAVSSLGSTWWAQFNNGDIYYSTDSGTNWTLSTSSVTGMTGTNYGNGLIYFQDYLFSFTPTRIFYADVSGGATGGAAWIDWTTTKGLTALSQASTSPITALHYPILYPNNRGVYFGNGATGSTTVGFFGQNGSTAFNPAGVTGTDFLYNSAALTLPSKTYVVESLNFLPPSNLAIALKASQDPQSADLITWDTISSNKFNPPLRLYSSTQGTNNQGIKQLVNRNQVLYAVAGGNHALFETNGSNFNLVEDISLYSNIRGGSGGETTLPVFFNSYPQGVCVLGNKLLTAVATPANDSYVSSPKGIFPIGVWSISFNPDGSKSTQCEFVVPALGNLSATATGSYSKITAIFPVGSNKFLVGYAQDASGVKTMGTALVDTTTYLDSKGYTSLESPLFEIGTALNPQTINLIEINLAKNLLTGQNFDLSYRTSLGDDWTVMNVDSAGNNTFDGDGTKNYYAYQKNNIGPTRYIQFRFRAESGSPNANESLELRNIIIS